MLRNSTNIPDELIGFALGFVRKFDGMNLELPRTIIVKNKARGLVRGQWGWYFPDSRINPGGKIVLIVPREINGSHSGKMRYSKLAYAIRSRAEFVVAVTAHEMRHHYQHTNWTGWRVSQTSEGRLAREVDAEVFELKVLDKFREMLGAQKVG